MIRYDRGRGSQSHRTPGMEIRETNLIGNFYKFDKAKYLTGVFLKAKNHGIISGDGGGSYIRKRLLPPPVKICCEKIANSRQ